MARIEAYTDAELVDRMGRGDRDALGALYERHAPRLAAIARHILGPGVEAEDLLHDVFLEVWRHARDYAQDRGSVWSWLLLRTRSRAIDLRRVASRRPSVELLDSHLETNGARDPNTEMVLASERGKLRAALAAMSEDEREVLLLGYFEGLSGTEIAALIGAPVGTVKSRTRSALAKLRDLLANPGETS
jgi:RNA polymerase sigma-70 factor (ECF subfamily)